MLLVSIYVFYSYRDFTNEYFTRQMVYMRLENNPYNFINYREISTQDDLYKFLTTTLAVQIFETQADKDKRRDGQSAVVSEETKYAFDHGLIPLGKLRFRQQRREVLACDAANQQIVDKMQTNDKVICQEDGSVAKTNVVDTRSSQ